MSKKTFFLAVFGIAAAAVIAVVLVIRNFQKETPEPTQESAQEEIVPDQTIELPEEEIPIEIVPEQTAEDPAQEEWKNTVDEYIGEAGELELPEIIF